MKSYLSPRQMNSTVKNDRVFSILTRQGKRLKATRNRWECLIRQSLSMKVMAQSGRFGSFICFAWIIIVAGILKRIFPQWIDLSLAVNSAVWYMKYDGTAEENINNDNNLNILKLQVNPINPAKWKDPSLSVTRRTYGGPRVLYLRMTDVPEGGGEMISR